MIIAVMSDTHDHIWNVRKALHLISARGARAIIHCGDFVAPFTLQELNEAGIPVHGVFGNNDGDQYLLTSLSLTKLHYIKLYGLVGRQEFDNFRVAFTHYRTMAEGLAASGKFDLVCFGHSHQVLLDTTGTTTLLNPGEVMGKDGSPGFYLVNTSTQSYERIPLS
ncbi:MAG: YfcE family phosphodiesterase [Deltaproteobacteria bacterium]|nr:YfcE family phosphodiesterase [Deltaproteobacteria bacterium]RLB87574.1 MAG: YfcE family phosphodiesterase [Deltaproteobacteria bacterium]RLB94043.1 MAG: YfcE family phosphodiesterase [Deltaproteobacteria bacterium]RLC10845.1 MAG: YfcE family phosphodiesterase [Deltaproteobacteria bacterium]